jgi:Ca2+-binding EF-hand superfamily protein
LKTLYTNYAEIGKGLNYNRFRNFLSAIFNIENHPFTDDYFLFFDKNHDNLIDFYEMVTSLDIIEKGSFDEKC